MENDHQTDKAFISNLFRVIEMAKSNTGNMSIDKAYISVYWEKLFWEEVLFAWHYN